MLVAAGVSDWRSRRVPNALNVAILGVGIAWSMLVADRSILQMGISIAVAFGTVLPFFIYGVYRGGDAKLLIACAAWNETLNWLVGFATGMLLGAAWALVVLARDADERSKATMSLTNLYLSRLGTLHRTLDSGRPTLPMAIPFGIGMLFVFDVELSKFL